MSDKTECGLSATKYCRIINSASCAKCPMKDANEDDVSASREYIDSILDHMPMEGVSSLHTGSECLLCAGEKNTAQCYAFTDIGHDEPKRLSKNLFGQRSSSKSGAFLPLAISCCKKCRKNYLLLEFLPSSISVFISAAALVLLSIRSIREPLVKLAPYLPVVVFAGAVGLSLLVSVLLKRFLLEKKSSQTQFNIFKLDRLRMLKLNGWFDLYGNKYTSKLVFHDAMPSSGLFMDYDGKSDKETVVPFERPGDDIKADAE